MHNFGHIDQNVFSPAAVYCMFFFSIPQFPIGGGGHLRGYWPIWGGEAPLWIVGWVSKVNVTNAQASNHGDQRSNKEEVHLWHRM